MFQLRWQRAAVDRSAAARMNLAAPFLNVGEGEAGGFKVADTVNIVALPTRSFFGTKPVDTRSGIRSRLICAREVTPVDS